MLNSSLKNGLIKIFWESSKYSKLEISPKIHFKIPTFITDKEIEGSPWGNQLSSRSYSKTLHQFIFIEYLPTEGKAVYLKFCFCKLKNLMPVSVGTTSIWEAFSCLILLFSPYRATADYVRQEPHLLRKRGLVGTTHDLSIRVYFASK